MVCDEPTTASTADHCSVNDGAPIDPVTSVRDLGIYVDADMVMRTHVYSGSVKMFRWQRCISPTTSEPPFDDAIHVQVAGGHWCYRGWTMETPFWAAFRPKYIAYSRC